MIRNGISKWCPFTSKKELVDWVSGYYEKPKSAYKKLSKRQLYAIFYKVQQQE